MDAEEIAPQQRRYFLFIVRLAAVIVGTSAATVLAMSFWLLRINGAFDPDPALVRSAELGTGDVGMVSGKFDRAVRTRFPLGTQESDLIHELLLEKFEPNWGGHRATYRRTSLICAAEYTVTWTADETFRLTRVSGEFRAICP